MPENEKVSVFGIRHHGPGSARSLLNGLKKLEPDCILIEGPPEANGLVQHVLSASMTPPVSLLIYAQDDLKKAVYYPFAVFSPEWQALVYGSLHSLPVRFMDLPQSNWLAIDSKLREFKGEAPDAVEVNASKPGSDLDKPDATSAVGATPCVAQPTAESDEADEAAIAEEGNVDNRNEFTTDNRDEPTTDNRDESTTDDSDEPTTNDSDEPTVDIRRDPLSWLAKAAGYDDSERWWENLVEHRRENLDVFAAISEAMTTLRNELRPEELVPDPFEVLREAHMRQTIRAALKEGYQRIAVICGAWHTPALINMPPAKEDQALLKGLPKVKVESTWIPWTHGRLSFESGYGAGVRSPGWYHHLWTSENQVLERWLASVARCLREEDLDASSAHIIEAVRLAETLASMRGQPLPGLTEINEAVQSVLCHGNSVPMQLIHKKLIVGDIMGEVPPDLPGTPLQKHLEREQKRLRMPAQSGEKIYDLDLRNANDLARSYLMHRLEILNVQWGLKQEVTGKSGTFHEVWRVRWAPEFVLALIEASVWGKTVEEAADAFICDLSDKAELLAALTQMLDRVLLADLPHAVEHVMRRVETEAAQAVDIKHLMAALPALVHVARYGNVRKTDLSSVQKILDGLISRICVGLPSACSSIDETASQEIFELLLNVHSAISLFQNEEHEYQWQDALLKLADGVNVNGKIAGRACRLLFDKKVFDSQESARRFGLALSTASEPSAAAAWADGFLRGSGVVLIHDNELLDVIDKWVQVMTDEAFTQIVPLLRRTFSTYSPPERRQIGERIARSGRGGGSSKHRMATNYDEARGAQVLPVLSQILGLVKQGDSGAEAK